MYCAQLTQDRALCLISYYADELSPNHLSSSKITQLLLFWLISTYNPFSALYERKFFKYSS